MGRSRSTTPRHGNRPESARVTVIGRDEQWATIDAACRGHGGTLLVLRGRQGEGKTALLEALAASWQDLRVCTAGAADEDGLAVVDALLNTARQHLEHGRDRQLLDAVAAAVRRRRDVAVAPQKALLPLVHELSLAMGVLANRTRTAVVIEDVDRCGRMLAAVLCPLVQRLRAVGCAVLVSMRDQPRPAAIPTQLLALADTTVELPPLSDVDIPALLHRWGRFPLDRTVLAALRSELGTLSGNPGALLSTVEHLRSRGRLVLVDEHFCLAPPREPVALPEDHALVELVRGDSTERLASALACVDHVEVDDLPLLASAAGIELGTSGQELDRLVASGVLRLDEPEVRFAVPALAGTLRRSAAQPRALHAALAEQMLARLDRGAPVDRRRLAEHLVRTDSGTTAGAHVLLDEADRIAEADPERAASWYHGALRHLPEHDERWPGLLRALLRLRMRLGQYRELAEDISLVAPSALAAPGLGGESRARSLIGLSWLTALLHDERAADVPPRLFAALGCATGVRRFSSAMFAGRFRAAADFLGELFWTREGDRCPDLEHVLVLLDAISCGHEEFQRAWSLWQPRPLPGPAADHPERLREAAAMSDYATALELLLGAEYGRPASGSVRTYQEVLRAYTAGSWDSALSLARSMDGELPAKRGTPARYLARALAAEICSARGDHRRAARWLDRTPRSMAGWQVVAWVRCGIRQRSGKHVEARHEGWRDYLRLREQGSPAGSERLLERLAELAVRAGRTRFAEQLLGEVDDLDDHLRTAGSHEAALLVRARVRGDRDAAVQGRKLAEDRGDLPQLARIHLVLGELSSDPRQWLHEAYALAKRFGAHPAREHLQDLMRRRGVALPRSRNREELFSSIEIRIIDLVSDGCTNRQIAMAVKVSEKTVESHLTRLFARTGCRSRVELAAAQLEGRLLERVRP